MKTLIKSSFLLLPLILILSCATGTLETNNKNNFRLKSFSIFDGNENLIQTVALTYNENNEPVEIVSMLNNNELNNRKTIKYTDSGKLSSIVNAMDNSTHIKTVYTYNDSDFLVKNIIKTSDDTVLGVNSYINDEKGNHIDWVSENPRSKEKIHFIMEYDDQNRMVKSSELDEQNNVIYFSESAFNDDGNETSYTIYTPTGEIDQQLKNSYKGNQIIKSEVTDENGTLLFHTEYKLDESSKPVTISTFNQYGDTTNRIVLKRDEKGREILRETYNFSGDLQEKIEKEYDSNGNNTMIIFYNDKDEIVSITRNSYEQKPLNMSEEEFNTLVFKL